MTVGEQIKTERVAKGWSREKLAGEAGVSLSTVIRAEKDRAPKWAHMVSIARALGASLDKFAAATIEATRTLAKKASHQRRRKSA